MRYKSDKISEIGVVKPRFNDNTRKVSVIGLSILLLALNGLLLSYLNIFLSLFIVLLLTLLFFRTSGRIFHGFHLVGTLVITDELLQFKEIEGEKSIPIQSIIKVTMHPLLGAMARYPDQWKVYSCEIDLIDGEVITQNITREEIQDGKLITSNVLKPSAFDLIKFLELKGVKINFGKYDDCYH